MAVLLLLVASPAWADCPLDLGHGTGLVVFSEHFIIAVRTDPAMVEIDEPIDFVLNVCTKNGDPAELMGVDAQLDEAHVLDEAPHIVPGADGRYRVENLTFTAAGSWEIGFNVRSDRDVERLTHDLIVR